MMVFRGRAFRLDAYSQARTLLLSFVFIYGILNHARTEDGKAACGKPLIDFAAAEVFLIRLLKRA
jgi:hypothetical protein